MLEHSRSFARFVTFSIVAMSSACSDFEIEDGLLGCDHVLLSPREECVSEDDPLAFTTSVEGLALGAETRISTLRHASLPGFRVTSSDPAIIEVEQEGNIITIRAVALGRAQITALEQDGPRELDSMSIAVEQIAQAEFSYPPNSQETLQELAGYVGSVDYVYVVYRSEAGRALVTDGVVEVAVNGPLSLGGEPEPRTSELARALFAPLPEGDAIPLTFEQSGPGSLTARTLEGNEFVLPISMVATPDELTIATEPRLLVNSPALVFLRGTTFDGVPVAGVRGVWSADPSDVANLTTLANPASEATIEPIRRGDLVVSVSVDGQVVSAALVVEGE
jgi:hypothetical protein